MESRAAVSLLQRLFGSRPDPREALRPLWHRTVELSRAYRHLQAVQEAEKSKLARDIHDELGSILVSAKMDASWVQQHLPDAPALMEKQSRLLSMLDEGVQIKRRLIEELRPTLLDNLGLCAALEWQTTEVCRRAQLTYHLQLPEEEPTLSSEATIGLFRIVQEALTNIVRYAKAKNVWIDLSAQPDEVSLRVRDDGIGIPEKAAHKLSHGLLGMRERVIALKGEFNIETAPGRGTSIVVRVPTAPPVAPVAPPALAALPEIVAVDLVAERPGPSAASLAGSGIALDCVFHALAPDG